MFTGRTVLVVVNPNSGRGRADDVAAAIETELERFGVARAEVRRTAAIEDASRWAADAADDGFDLILAVGGDGTVTEVANGMLRAGRPLPIGIVPLGTGNGMARVLQLPTDPLRALAALHAGHVVELDAVDVTSHGRWALMFLGLGLDAEINRDADAGSKRRFGYLAYVGATLRNVLNRRNHRITMTLDEHRVDTLAHSVTVFNAGQFDVGGIDVGPPANPRDGRLDVAVFHSPSPLAIGNQVMRLLTGRPLRSDLVRAARVRIEAHPPLLVHIDGDVVGRTPLDARIRPNAISFLADTDYAPEPTDEDARRRANGEQP